MPQSQEPLPATFLPTVPPAPYRLVSHLHFSTLTCYTFTNSISPHPIALCRTCPSVPSPVTPLPTAPPHTLSPCVATFPSALPPGSVFCSSVSRHVVTVPGGNQGRLGLDTKFGRSGWKWMNEVTHTSENTHKIHTHRKPNFYLNLS